MGNATKSKLRDIPFGVTPEENAKRQQLWRGFDVNGNGFLSLAEVDKGVRDVLNIPELFESKPAMMRAFQASKKKMKSKNARGDDYVSKGEFRFLLICLRQYYEYWIDFEEIDVSGDRRLDIAEFKRALPLMAKWGVKVNDPDATFNMIKEKGHEKTHITFTDFCDWAVGVHLSYHGDSDSHDF